MRWMRFFLAAAVMAIAITLVFVFLVFEKEQHERFCYMAEINTGEVQEVVIDKHKTEDRIIYRETAFYPRNIYGTKVNAKIVFKKKGHVFEKFFSEKRNGDTLAETTHIEGKPGAFDFLSSYNSRFSAAMDVPCRNDISVFSPRVLVTYLPLVEKYDFSRGGSQPFNIFLLGRPLMPPARGKVVLTSIKDELLTYAGKTVKTECLIVKTNAAPEAKIWVSKKDKSILILSIKSDYGFTARKVPGIKKLTKMPLVIENAAYISEEVMIPSGDVGISGTLTIPEGVFEKDAFPAVLFVAGELAATRDNAGLYSFLADAMSEEGFITLRFDRRGTGKSQGDNMFASIKNDLDDMKNALDLLYSNERVDGKNVFIVAHSESALLLTQAGLTKFPVAGLVMLSPRLPVKILDPESESASRHISYMQKFDGAYEATLRSLEKYTESIVKNASRDGVFVLQKPVFVKRMIEIDKQNFLSGIKDTRVPVLIIYGKDDLISSASGVKNIEEAFRDAGLKDTRSVYFRTLGHFLGKTAKDPEKVKYYSPDIEVIQTLKKWLNEKCESEGPPPEVKEPETIKKDTDVQENNT
ncbi:MAG: alpha/beta fold hydrolase [Candidatus Omnitrophica bacterium]|nr:alpha/beta fold hydrolase [Candidatus Omnitrophota bacterium]